MSCMLRTITAVVYARVDELATMGNKQPTPKLLTDYPWRKFQSSGSSLENRIVKDIKKLAPVAMPGILIVGPVSSGKSSFINSCLSVGVGRKKLTAKTGCAEKSYTLEFKRYTDYELLKNFRLMDCMGINPRYGNGLHLNDIFFLLGGHIKKNYMFDSDKPMTKDNEFYERNPKFDDKAHCVVIVLDANAMYDSIPSEYIDRIRWLQTKIKEADVPRVLILTKADLLCEEVKRNPSVLFRSVKVQEAVKAASEVFDIEQASIHPLINYEVDYELTTDKNIAILLALRQILQYATDRVEYVLHED